MRAAQTPPARSPYFADFDHTLLAGNSTELFIAACKPSFLAALVELLVRRCIPWRWTGLPQWFRLRDYACCLCLILLMPWNLLIWRRVAPGLFARLESRMVAERLRRAGAGRVVIVSFGMAFVIRAMLRGSAWQDCRLIATPLLPALGRFRAGKLHLVEGHFSATEIAHADFITDSRDDADLLQAAGRGELIAPQGPAISARERLYLPLRYTAAAKYTRSYVLDQILLVDILLVALSISVTPGELLAALGFVPFLTISLMGVYEIGYYENDMVAARREAAPTLKPAAARYRDFPIEPDAWLWSLATGALGLAGAHWAGMLGSIGLAGGALGWVAMLLVLRAVFYVYNRRPPGSRILLYPVLNAIKFGPIFFLMEPTKFGVVLAFSQVAMMWVIYITYRYGGSHNEIRKDNLRFMLFGIGAALLASSAPFASLGGLFQLGAILAWLTLRLCKAPALALLRGRRRQAAGPLAAQSRA